MSDLILRRLERAVAQGGALTDEAAYLRERLRVGAVREEGLGLAAYLGHAASQVITGRRGSLGARSWLLDLVRHDGPLLDVDPEFAGDAILRIGFAAVAAAFSAELSAVERLPAGVLGAHTLARRAMAAIAAWLVQDRFGPAVTLEELCADFARPAEGIGRERFPFNALELTALALDVAGRPGPAFRREDERRGPRVKAHSRRFLGLTDIVDQCRDALRELGDLDGAARVRRAVRADLISWALREGDPVAPLATRYRPYSSRYRDLALAEELPAEPSPRTRFVHPPSAAIQRLRDLRG